MGLCLWPMIFGVPPLSTYVKLTILLKKQRPEGRTLGEQIEQVGLLMAFPHGRVEDSTGNLGGFMAICDRGPATSTGYKLEGPGLLGEPCLSPRSPLQDPASGRGLAG